MDEIDHISNQNINIISLDLATGQDHPWQLNRECSTNMQICSDVPHEKPIMITYNSSTSRRTRTPSWEDSCIDLQPRKWRGSPKNYLNQWRPTRHSSIAQFRLYVLVRNRNRVTRTITCSKKEIWARHLKGNRWTGIVEKKAGGIPRFPNIS